jgi:signal transduction histidine kinase
MFSFLFGNSIKKLIALWVSIVVGACLILAGALFMISQRLELYNIRILLDSRSKETALSLTNTILEQHRTDLLWSLTGGENLKKDKTNTLDALRRIIDNLDISATTADEERLIDEIEDRFHDYADARSRIPQASSAALTSVTNTLLQAAEKLWNYNNTQMNATIASQEKLFSFMHRWLVVLSILVAFVIVSGSVELTRRVIRPVVELSHAAVRFRQGDFGVRTRIFYNDELGSLSRLFNEMAGNIELREKSRHEFIAALFHDIKNPLVNIGAILRLLHRKSLSPEESRVWLERMLRETDRIEDIIQDITDTVQVETGRLTLQTAELDLSRLVEDVHAEQSAIITHHHLLYEREGTGMVLGDRRRLERVITNLLSNAVKYSPEGTTVTLRVSHCEGRAVFSVTDQGVGISPEDQKTLFQPFGRLAHTRTMAHGSGLGLYIVKKIIEAHGGSIRLVSSPGQGTTVEIALPLAE